MRIYGHVKAQRQVPFEDIAVNAGREILTFSQCLQKIFSRSQMLICDESKNNSVKECVEENVHRKVYKVFQTISDARFGEMFYHP